ncbi:MAG TPA: hypothetical protein V6C89_05205 [Drouetiella sp.]|jgi:hypothetical protein
MKKNQRDGQGFSLIFVASMGFVMVLMALAATSALIPIYQNVGAQNLSAQTQAAAEVGAQYAMAKLNTAADLTSVPASLTLPAAASNANVTVTIESLTSAQLAGYAVDNIAADNFAKIANTPAPDYRRITSIATLGVAKSAVYLIVKAVQTQAVPSSGAAGMPNPPSAYFNNALFAGDTLTISNTGGSRMKILSENSTRQAQIGSNNLIVLSGRSVIDGNVIANNDDRSVSIRGSSNNRINGNLTYNGIMSNNVSSTSPAFLVDSSANLDRNPNVLGDGSFGPTPTQGTITSNGSTQTEFAPMIPVQATTSATYTATGTNSSTVTAPGAGQVVNLGAINLHNSDTLTLPAGNYTATSISIQDNAQITTTSSANATGVNITVQGQSALSTPINIGGKGITQSGTPSATNVQIFYAGQQNVAVSLASGFSKFYGLIYAPNANVNVSMTGQEFHGAVAGNNVSLTGTGSFFYDPGTVHPGLSSSSTNNTSNSLYYVKNPASTNNGFQTIAWIEPDKSSLP